MEEINKMNLQIDNYVNDKINEKKTDNILSMFMISGMLGLVLSAFLIMNNNSLITPNLLFFFRVLGTSLGLPLAVAGVSKTLMDYHVDSILNSSKKRSVLIKKLSKRYPEFEEMLKLRDDRLEDLEVLKQSNVNYDNYERTEFTPIRPITINDNISKDYCLTKKMN